MEGLIKNKQKKPWIQFSENKNLKKNIENNNGHYKETQCTYV